MRRVGLLASACAVMALFVGVVFAGSPSTLASGVQIGGLDVGGLTPRAAARALEQRAAALAKSPVVFHAGGEKFRVTPSMLGVEADWQGAVALARKDNDGFVPVRGYRRLHTRVFGEEIEPRTSV